MKEFGHIMIMTSMAAFNSIRRQNTSSAHFSYLRDRELFTLTLPFLVLDIFFFAPIDRLERKVNFTIIPYCVSRSFMLML